MEQELLILPVVSGVRVTRSLVLCVCFVDRCLSFWSFIHLAIVLSVLHLAIVSSVLHLAIVLSVLHLAIVLSVLHLAIVLSVLHLAIVLSVLHLAIVLSVLHLAIVLSVLHRYTDSDYHLNIFKLLFSIIKQRNIIQPL